MNEQPQAPVYKPGDIANNHVLEADGVTWRLLPPPPGRQPNKAPTGKKTSAGRTVAICAALGGGLLVIAAISSPDDDPVGTSTRSSSAPSSVEVLYEVEGSTNQASITISTPGGGTSQQSDIDVPMTRKSSTAAGLSFTYRPGEFVYLSAQNSNDSGSVTCRITVDGVVVSENTSHGAYVIASCDGQA